MSTTAESIAPPRPCMPAVWDLDAQGLPIRHRPDQPHADLWNARCGEAFLFDFPAMRAVMELTPCLECAELEP